MSGSATSLCSASSGSRSASSSSTSLYDTRDLRISFSGAGFLGIYHGGVAAAMEHFLPGAHYSHCSGVSVGSMAAAALVGNVPISLIINAFLEACAHARTYTLGPWNPVYDLTDQLRQRLENILPEDIHIIARGRLSVSVTKVYDGSNTILTNFLSRSELIEACLCSAFVPLMSGFMPGHYRGQRIIDGGLSCNLIDELENTITVSPLAGDAHICPIDDLKVRKHSVHRLRLAKHGLDLTVANLKRLRYCVYPHSLETLERLMEEGFRDAHRFLRKHGLTHCRQCLTIKSHVSHCRDTVACDVYSSKNVKMPRRLKQLYSEASAPKAMAVKRVVIENKNEESFGMEDMKKVDKMEKNEDKIEEKEHKNQNVMLRSLYNVVYKLVYYSPLVVAARWSYRSTSYITSLVMNQLGGVMPSVRTAEPRFVEALETMVGTLVSKALSEECYHKLSPSQAKLSKSRRAQMRPRAQFKPQISCDLSIYSLMEEDELAANYTEPLAEMASDDEERLSRRSSMHNDEEVEIYNVRMEMQEPNLFVSEPNSEQEARALMADNLLKVFQSRNASRVVSRLASRQESRHESLVHSRSESRASLISNQEALENLIKVTEEQESMCSYYYTDANGDIVTMNVFDISDTNPEEIIIDEEMQQLAAVDSELDMSEVQRRLQAINQGEQE